ncbi:MAG: fumarylacetoacetate hydrolase family protein [Alphaproteobacteria bacterium]|nr:fumarylacetoacetate hydrolase family protein [Alphaproteobacteria bacterium]
MAHISAAHQIHQCLVNDSAFPDTLSQTLSVQEAYDVQFELLDLRLSAGDIHAGWKVGLTAKAMQEQQGVHEPCLGHLVAKGQLSSPARLIFDELMAPGFENELCMRMKAPLSGANVGLDAAKAAIGDIAPAMEIVEKRGVFKDDFPLAVAGNVQQRAFVTGEFQAYHPDMDLSAIRAEIFVNGQSREIATGQAVLGDPMQSIVWLTHKLSQYGRGLQPGDLIMSGSFTRQYDAAKGDRIRAEFTQLGAVEAHFA